MNLFDFIQEDCFLENQMYRAQPTVQGDMLAHS